jgi:hypothetical protein
MIKKINYYLDKYFGIEIIRSRPKESIKFAHKYFKKKKLIAIEIGVLKGQNSEDILKNLNIKKIYLVDPYIKYEKYKKDGNYGKLIQAEKEAKTRLRKYPGKIEWIKDFSEKAIKKINEYVDFIYIDGNHEYEYVKKDLELYWKKLNKKGIIAGHDIQCEGVSKALLEFSEKKKLKVFFGDRRDWWIIK